MPGLDSDIAVIGAGVVGSATALALARLPVGERIEPSRDVAWRDRHHAEWREFVKRAAEL